MGHSRSRAISKSDNNFLSWRHWFHPHLRRHKQRKVNNLINLTFISKHWKILAYPNFHINIDVTYTLGFVLTVFLSKDFIKLLFEQYCYKTLLNSVKSGSTARNASARISTARHFFQKCHLLDKQTSSARQKKVCRTCSACQFRAVDKKTASARIFEQMTKFFI